MYLKPGKLVKGLVSKALERWIKVALLPEQNDGQKVLSKIQERKAGYSKTLQCLRANKSEQWEKQNCKPRFVVAGSLCCEGKREHSCHIQNGNTKTNLEQEAILCIWQACYLQEAAKEKALSHGVVGDLSQTDTVCFSSSIQHRFVVPPWTKQENFTLAPWLSASDTCEQ